MSAQLSFPVVHSPKAEAGGEKAPPSRVSPSSSLPPWGEIGPQDPYPPQAECALGLGLVKCSELWQPMAVIEKLVSGGQTGADIAALDAALRFSFPHGGWCPKGRRSLEGPIPIRYLLEETPSASYLQRTEWNVRDSDGTVVFTIAPEVTGGSLRTLGFATKHRKPCLHLSRLPGGLGYQDRSELLCRFVRDHGIRHLNVAGSRESKEPGIHAWVMEVLEQAFFYDRLQPGMLGGPGEG